MKIAILFRGPVRPDYRTALNNVSLLKDCFLDHDVTVNFYTWDSPDAQRLIVSANYAKQYKFFPEPSREHIIHQLAKANVTNLRWVNLYKQYWMMKEVIPLVGNHDFIVQSRFDAKIKIARDKVHQWLDSSSYNTIHVKGVDAFTNDQFGIATPYVMLQAWDYHDLNTLGQFMNNAGEGPAEQILDQIIAMNNVKIEQAPIEIWELDKRRHLR